MTSCFPVQGRVECAICHEGQAHAFDRTQTEGDGWRITNNPLAFGGAEPDVAVLGFSKGPTQAGDLSRTPLNEIAFKGGRTNLAKILHHVGLLERPDASMVDGHIVDAHGQFHFGSLIRCTVERFDADERVWKGTGGGMLDRFLATSFGSRIAGTCETRFLSELPSRTRLIVMLGMGAKGNYVAACRKLFEAVRPGPWSRFNEVSYFDGQIVVVHTEHFASQGALIPNWLGGAGHERGRFGLLAREGVDFALSRKRAGQD
jgi:hypothetical protein